MRLRGARILLLAPALLAAAAGLFIIRPRPLLVVALDKAFEATRPGLVAELERPRLFGNRILLLGIPVDNSAPALLREIQERRIKPRALALSPLLARALVEGAARNGAPPPAPLIALEWAPPGAAGGGVASLRSDPIPAARRLGGLYGGLIAELRRGSAGLGAPSPSAQGALVWEEGPGRDEGEARAFREAFAAAAGEEPLELALEAGSSAADSLIRGLFSADIRVLFVEAGSFAPAVLDQAEGRVSLQALGGPGLPEAAEAWPELAIGLVPDEAGFADLLRSPGIFALRGQRSLPSILSLLPGRAPRDFDLKRRLERAPR